MFKAKFYLRRQRIHGTYGTGGDNISGNQYGFILACSESSHTEGLSLFAFYFFSICLQTLAGASLMMGHFLARSLLHDESVARTRCQTPREQLP